MKQERGIKEKGESEMKIGRFSAAEKTKKFKKTDDDDEALDSQAMTVTAAKKRGSLYTPSGVLQSLKWKRISKAARGIVNIGNTCFLNSILQCLLRVPALVQPLCDETESSATILSGMTDTSISKIFRDFANEYWGGRSVKALRPTSMVSALEVRKGWKHGNQEDAHEFLRLLLNYMHKDILDVLGFDRDGNESTFISRVFGGKEVNELTCLHCNSTSRAYNPFLDLSLELGDGISTVEEALAAFLKMETLSLENARDCEHCERREQATKQLSIAELPNTLVLNLKRFTHQFDESGEPVVRKITKEVSFPPTLGLPPTHEKQSNIGATPAFHLTGVVVHQERLQHYVAFVCGSNGQWYKMNDSVVTAVTEAEVLKQEAYILFYSSAPACALPLPLLLPLPLPLHLPRLSPTRQIYSARPAGRARGAPEGTPSTWAMPSTRPRWPPFGRGRS
jgi:ubiquitin C-terminal hydrolase